MINNLKIYSPLFVPIIAGYLVLYKRHHIDRIFDTRFFTQPIMHKPPIFSKKVIMCSECNKISKTKVCFSCWMRITGYPESNF